MSDPKMIKEIIAAVSIPVMAKARIGHFVEAQILETLGVDCIDESEVLTPADGRKTGCLCVCVCLWVCSLGGVGQRKLALVPVLASAGSLTEKERLTKSQRRSGQRVTWVSLEGDVTPWACQIPFLAVFVQWVHALSQVLPPGFMPSLHCAETNATLSSPPSIFPAHPTPTPFADRYHIDKSKFTIPFVCGARNLGEAMRRVHEVSGKFSRGGQGVFTRQAGRFHNTAKTFS